MCTELKLTAKEIKLVAIEAKGVDTYAPNFLEDFSNRAYRLVIKSGLDFGYVVRRCLFLNQK